jgi:hypothetical protein
MLSLIAVPTLDNVKVAHGSIGEPLGDCTSQTPILYVQGMARDFTRNIPTSDECICTLATVLRQTFYSTMQSVDSDGSTSNLIFKSLALFVVGLVVCGIGFLLYGMFFGGEQQDSDDGYNEYATHDHMD